MFNEKNSHLVQRGNLKLLSNAEPASKVMGIATQREKMESLPVSESARTTRATCVVAYSLERWILAQSHNGSRWNSRAPTVIPFVSRKWIPLAVDCWNSMADTLQLERNLIHFVHVHEFCSLVVWQGYNVIYDEFTGNAWWEMLCGHL